MTPDVKPPFPLQNTPGLCTRRLCRSSGILVGGESGAPFGPDHIDRGRGHPAEEPPVATGGR